MKNPSFRLTPTNQDINMCRTTNNEAETFHSPLNTSSDASSSPMTGNRAPHTVCGADFSALVGLSQEESLKRIMESYITTGLQATQIGRARELLQHVFHRRRLGGSSKQAIFVSYTSNLISSGLREAFVFLAKEKLVDGFVSTAGGIEEDIIKCLGPTLLGSFHLSGTELRKKGLNRIGNLLVPNDNYCFFEDFFTPILKEIHEDQRSSRWSDHTAPSQFIRRMAKKLAADYPPAVYEESLLYWCDRNDIPVFCPAFTDGSMGDMLYFYNFSRKGIIVDPVRDVFLLRSLVETPSCGVVPTSTGEHSSTNLSSFSTSRRCAALVLGGGLPKHHLLYNIPMDDVIMITTGNEADGCTSSGSLRDDFSSGLLPYFHQNVERNTDCRDEKKVIKIQGDATLIFPLLLI